MIGYLEPLLFWQQTGTREAQCCTVRALTTIELCNEKSMHMCIPADSLLAGRTLLKMLGRFFGYRLTIDGKPEKLLDTERERVQTIHAVSFLFLVYRTALIEILVLHQNCRRMPLVSSSGVLDTECSDQPMPRK